MKCSRCGCYGGNAECVVCAPEEEYIEEDGIALAKEQEFFDSELS
jgi:hypothetical protein